MMEGASPVTERSLTGSRYSPLRQVGPPVQPSTTHQAATTPTKPSYTDLPPDAVPPTTAAHDAVAQGVVAVQCSAPYGRYLVAERDVRAGEVVLQEAPLLVVPKAGVEPSCLCCLAPLRHEWTGCRRCGGPLCSTECSGGHHGATECGLLQRMGLRQAPHIDALVKELNVILGPLRLLILVQESAAAHDVFMSLESHAERRSKLAVGRFVEEHIAGGLRQRLGLDPAPGFVQRLCGILDTNCFEVTLDNGGRGRAVFAAAAMMNHSCVPNAHWWFSRGRITVQATMDIPRGRPVLISYTHTLWGTRARGAHLAACKMFTCTCRRCLDPTELGTHLSSLHCRACEGGVMVPPADPCNPWTCAGCGNTLAAATVEAMVGAAATALARLNDEDAATVAATTKHLCRVLGPQYYVVAQAQYCLLEMLFRHTLTEASVEQLEEAVGAARQLGALVRQLEPGVSRLSGLLLYYETAATAEQMRRGSDTNMEAVQGLMQQAEEVEKMLQYDRFLTLAASLTASLRCLCPDNRQHGTAEDPTPLHPLLTEAYLQAPMSLKLNWNS